jgi:hypothetical protein
MKKFRYVLILILILGFCQIAFTSKRKKPITMKELTDPSSHSYVPCPYPKNRKEIIINLKYAIEKFYTPQPWRHSVNIGSPSPSKTVLPNLLEEKPIYKIGKIIKVKNLLAGLAYDYFWLVDIQREDGSSAARVIIDPTGLWGGTKSRNLDQPPLYLKTEKEIKKLLSETLGQPLLDKDIKYIEAIGLPPFLGTLFVPAYEIELKNGSRYYFSHRGNMFFQAKEEISWKKNKKGYRKDVRQLTPLPTVISLDEINDKIVVYEELKKK